MSTKIATLRIAAIAACAAIAPMFAHAQQSSSIAGQSTAGTSITSQTVPAPIIVSPPINPNPGTTPQSLPPPLTVSQRAKRSHTVLGTSNTFQNGVNGTEQSDAVANGTATGAPPVAAPTPPASAAGTPGQPRQ
jgi:hypothetical protein